MRDASRDEFLRRQDLEARRRAQVVFDRPFVLEAGAGTGKTAALVSRILAWSVGPGWERGASALREEVRASGAASDADIAHRVLSRVVAITFTEAAAAEMASRCEAAFRELEKGELPIGAIAQCLPEEPMRRRRAGALRGALDHLEVHTIHAWCRRLLAQHPLEARLHPRLEIDAEGRRGEEAVREVLELRLREAYAEPGDPDVLALAESGVAPRDFEEALLSLLEDGPSAEALDLDPLNSGRLRRLCERLQEALEAVWQTADGHLDGCRVPVAEATCARVNETRERLEREPFGNRPQLDAFLAWLRREWADNEIGRIVSWGRGKFGQREAQRLGDRTQALSRTAQVLGELLTHLVALDPDRLERGRRVLGPWLGEVEAQLRARGVLTFSSLLSETARLLAHRSDVAAQVRSRIDQLLIDEFQDTDRRQCDIVRAIALEGPADRRPGLFLVGDPKQSIYGWRSADLAAYEVFARDVEKAGGVRCRLSVNYRSAPPVLDEIERIAAPLLIEVEGVQPSFQPLIPSPQLADERGFSAGRFAPVEFWLPDSRESGSGGKARTSVVEAAQIEATALARDLRELHDEHGVSWSSVGVLFRSRGEWDIYLAALREAGVPYAVDGDRHYYQRREVIDASAWVRAVFDPNDQVALLALLRSSAVGVPDAALLPLWRRGFPVRVASLEELDAEERSDLDGMPREVAASLPRDVPGLERIEGWDVNLREAIRVLAELRRSFRCDPPDLAVERMRTALLFEVGESARFHGAWRIANLDRFFRDLTRDLCDTDCHRVLRRLRTALLDEEEAEEATPREVIDDAVRLLTIHGAKGLDFDHVYVMQLHKSSRSPGIERVAPGEIDGVSEYALLGAATPGFDQVRGDRARVADAELVRTLYVAMTRAKGRLVLSGLWPPKGTRERSHASLLRRRALAPPDLVAAFRRLADRGQAAFFDAADARWVFPDLSPSRAVSAAGEEDGPVALASLAEVDADVRRLRVAREAAEGMRESRFGGTASGDSSGAWQEGRGDREDGEERGFGDAGARLSSGGGDVGSGEIARAVGTAVHRALEDFDWTADPEAEVARRIRALERELVSLSGPEAAEAAVVDARALFESWASGPLFASLRALAPRVVARELPILLPPQLDLPIPKPGGGSVGFVSGTIDLLYRDPRSDALVVGDYKTDRVATEDLMRHSRAYAAQGGIYQRAVRDAFQLSYLPRFELWYLRPGEIVAV
ncbi:MAG: UvrD-helicase domain-containing protein [Myxococcota bacterium]